MSFEANKIFFYIFTILFVYIFTISSVFIYFFKNIEKVPSLKNNH